MARLFADENFPFPVVVELRRLGHDVLTIQEAGRANLAVPDEAVLALANDEDRAVLTLNRRHFIRLHNNSAAHAGIIVCTFDPNFLAQAGRIDQAIESQETLRGCLVRVNRPES